MDLAITKKCGEVMIAASEPGVVVQRQPRYVRHATWFDDTIPLWDWHNYSYRIKPQPKTVIRYVVVHGPSGSEWTKDTHEDAIEVFENAMHPEHYAIVELKGEYIPPV